MLKRTFVGGVVVLVGVLGCLNQTLWSQVEGVITIDEPRGDPILRGQRQQLEQQAISLRQTLSNMSTSGVADPTDRELKLALDRYFAQKQLTKAIEYLEQMATKLEGSPEANTINSAIEVLRQNRSDIKGIVIPQRGTPADDDPLDDSPPVKINKRVTAPKKSLGSG